MSSPFEISLTNSTEYDLHSKVAIWRFSTRMQGSQRALASEIIRTVIQGNRREIDRFVTINDETAQTEVMGCDVIKVDGS